MNAYEIYAKEICSNCKNRENCTEELRKRLDNTLKCYSYIKDRKKKGYKQFEGRTANQRKPIMRL